MKKPYSDWKFSYKNQKRKEVLKEFESWTRQDFIAHILQLRQEVLDQEKKNEELQQTVDNFLLQSKESTEKKEEPPPESKYSQDWPYSTKIVFLIVYKNLPLTSSQLHGLLHKMDAGYKYLKDPKKNLTVRLCQLVKSGRIQSVKLPGIKTLYYSLPEWVDGEGHLEKEHLRKIQSFE